MFKLNKGLTLHLGDGRTITATDDECYVRDIPPGTWVEVPPAAHEPAVITIPEFYRAKMGREGYEAWFDWEMLCPVTPP